MEDTTIGLAEDKITSVVVNGSGRKSDDGKGIKSSEVGEDEIGSGVGDWPTAVVSGRRKVSNVVDCMTSEGCNVTNCSLEDESGRLGISVGIIWSNGSEVAGITSADWRTSGCEVAGFPVDSDSGARLSTFEVKNI